MKYKNKAYSYGLIIVFALLSVCNLSAQSKTIVTGTVTAEGTSQPLIGATIAEKDKNNRIISGAVVDFDGNSSCELPKTISFVTKPM